MGCTVSKKVSNEPSPSARVFPSTTINIISATDEGEDQIAASRIVEIDSNSFRSHLNDAESARESSSLPPKPIIEKSFDRPDLSSLQFSQAGEIEADANGRFLMPVNRLTPLNTEMMERCGCNFSESSITPNRKDSKFSLWEENDHP
eukprot:TRINITY_DN5050_c0_g1_i3.p2 TRINITY_DN5050_c0_g1~~TRINITY_DN5050_c0_g1_i3.p2  ORF type:complete len:147 (+),score=28.96 TRINITY_DN5050_c0_g1_i3:199-639(+)